MKRKIKKIGRTSRAPTDIDIAIGKYIRKRRLDMGMTLAELGADLGISHQQLQKYEIGTNRLSAGTLYQTAAVLRVTIHDLFSLVDSVNEPPSEDSLTLQKDQCISIIRRTNSMSTLKAMKKVLFALSKSE